MENLENIMNFNFTITVGKLQIPTYRELLCMVSPVFKAMFDNDKDCKSIELDETVDETVDEKAISGFFNAILPTNMANAITNENRRGVLSLAFKYDVTKIVNYIEKLEIDDVKTNVNRSSISGYNYIYFIIEQIKLASKFKLNKLQKKILEEMNRCTYYTLSEIAKVLPNIDKDFAVLLGVRVCELIGHQGSNWKYKEK